MAFLIKMAMFMELLQLAAVGAFRACLHPRHRAIVTPGDVLIVLLIPLVGLFGQNKHVFYALLFLLPLFWVGNPTGFAKRYVLVLVLFPELQEVYGFGSLYLGPLSSFTFFNAGALVALAMTRRGKLGAIRSSDAAIWMLFLVTLLFYARGEPINGTLRYVLTTFLLVIPPYFIVARAVGSARAVGDTVSFVVLGGLCNAIVALFESVKHWAMYETFYQTLHVKLMSQLSANLSMRAGLLRANGAVGNYELLGLVTGTALLAAFAVRRRFTTPGFYIVVVLLAGGLFSSQARSAWIATLVGLALQAAYDRRWRRLAVVAGGIGLAGALSLAASAGGALGEMLGKGGHAESTAQYRQTLLSRGLEEAARHPLTGQTFDQLQVSMNDLRQGEHIIDFVNTHLLVMLVSGAGGLTLWILAWAMPMARGWRARSRSAGGRDTVSAGFPFAAMGMTFLFLTFTSPVDRILSLAAISMGLMSVCLRSLSLVTDRPRAGASVTHPSMPALHGLAR